MTQTWIHRKHTMFECYEWCHGGHGLATCKHTMSKKCTLLALNQAKFYNVKCLPSCFCDGFLVVSVLGFLLAIEIFICRTLFFKSYLELIGLGTIVEALQKTNISTLKFYG